MAYVFPESMIYYGKTAANAVSIMSYLAEIYHEATHHAGSKAIAQQRKLSHPLVAKILTTLSTASLVYGTPGPGGGYSLARPPEEIRLVDIVQLFEQLDRNTRCPYGPDWCGNGDPCPLHDSLLKIRDDMRAFLENTSLHVFVTHKQEANFSI